MRKPATEGGNAIIEMLRQAAKKSGYILSVEIVRRNPLVVIEGGKTQKKRRQIDKDHQRQSN